MTDVDWSRLRAEELRALAARDAVVLLPVASTEQHGPHLATGTDTYLCGEVCRRAARLADGAPPVVVAPTVWMGLAEHHVALGGTFSLGLSTWHALLRDLCTSIGRAGFRRILVVNGHGGNVSALNALTVDLTRETGLPIATTNYFAFAETALREVLEDQAGVQHACEAETSMMMAIHPDLVDESRLPEAHGPLLSMSDALARRIQVWRPFPAMTPNGVLGDARRSSAAKGAALLDGAARAMADAIAAGGIWPEA